MLKGRLGQRGRHKRCVYYKSVRNTFAAIEEMRYNCFTETDLKSVFYYLHRRERHFNEEKRFIVFNDCLDFTD